MDFIRGPSVMAGQASRGAYKEWFHFLVFGEDFSLLVNFSLHADEFSNSIRPNLTAVVCSEGAWCGDVSALDVKRLVPGETGIDADCARFVFDGANYQIDVRRPDVKISLQLQPLTMPQFAGTATLAEGRFSWLAVPHLRAHGAVEAQGHYFRVNSAPAYHDHNWGRFRWGGAYAWQWGVAVPTEEVGYGLVFDRVVNTRTQDIVVQGSILFRGADHLRTFVDPEVSCSWHGSQIKTAYRIPPIMRMAIPGNGPGVPETCSVTSLRKRDRVDLRLTPRDTMEIGIPSDIDCGSPMILSEAFGDGEICGTIGGIPFDNRVLGVFEQIERGAHN